MENRLDNEQWVMDSKLQTNGGLPVQIIKIEGDTAQVWYIRGEAGVATEEFIPLNDIKSL